ncbi:TlpA disulfide reductase family protein [Aeromicrobium sp.]|uniref:TlpA family protein disulfide reductase n=1 Tax=Aeromicrobium sp. TaxID=1871063 RepID=UPI0019862B0F|nr:TlpA disulfide reductase family protein [Aeromicrobium sp.]MBC7630507.1 TlpA family protein disulfide reductase [Aeromicrobium sp.]
MIRTIHSRPTHLRVLVPVAVLALLAACGGTGNRGTTTGFVSGDGTIVTVKAADRKMAPVLEGDDLDGKPITSATYAGKILVVNVWGSWCPPCRAEAPALTKVSDEYASKNVQFLGIAVRDNDAAAKSFNRLKGVNYPSISDYYGKTLLGFGRNLPSQAIPTTWIFDAKGRVAVRIMTDGLTAGTLSGLIDDVQAGRA